MAWRDGVERRCGETVWRDGVERTSESPHRLFAVFKGPPTAMSNACFANMLLSFTCDMKLSLSLSLGLQCSGCGLITLQNEGGKFERE